MSNKKKTLLLPVKKKWFEQIKSGEKPEEFRLYNDYWRKRIENKEFDQIVITLGYPKRDDHERRLERPWRGYEVREIKHPEFENVSQTVFCIKVNDDPKILYSDNEEEFSEQELENALLASWENGPCEVYTVYEATITKCPDNLLYPCLVVSSTIERNFREIKPSGDFDFENFKEV